MKKMDSMKIKEYFAEKEGELKLNSNIIKYLEVFLHWLTNSCKGYHPYDNDYLMECINMERPDRWFESGEKKEPRVFIYHHGPTNSGKSSAAI